MIGTHTMTLLEKSEFQLIIWNCQSLWRSVVIKVAVETLYPNLSCLSLFQIWGDLLRTKKPPEDRPELLCSLNYLPQAERLTVVIMQAKNLETIQETYVKVCISNFLTN